MLRWLHISDIHLGAGDGHEHDVVLGALVRAFEAGGPLADRRPSVFFCTGDLSQSGNAKELAAAAAFLRSLARAAGVRQERIFVVPGNHDVDRSRVSKRFVLDLVDAGAVSAFFGPDGAEDREIAFRRFTAFAEFQREQLSLPLDAARPYLLSRFEEGGERVGVLGLNTAWLAHEDGAQGKLIVGERLVRQALDELAAGSVANGDTLR